jgi:hypothetical protein
MWQKMPLTKTIKKWEKTETRQAVGNTIKNALFNGGTY